MSDNAADDFLLALKFIPDLFITSNVIGKLYDVVFSLVIWSLAFLHSLAMIKVLILLPWRALILRVTILTILILKLLIILYLWGGIIDLIKTKHVKRDRWRITNSSMASNKIVGLVHLKTWKKEVESFLIHKK